jgi:hypothetical protein
VDQGADSATLILGVGDDGRDPIADGE